ncbi:MAG: cupin domain-containing protein [Ginsengibacter sp.]
MKKQTPGQSFVSSADIDFEATEEGVSRQILAYDDSLMMVAVHFKKGAVGSIHSHVHRQISYVESGRFEITIDGNKKTLEKGDSFLVAPDLLHGVVALEQGILIDIFTPSRKDFL